MKKIIFSLYLSIFIYKLHASDSTILKVEKEINGVYECGIETLIINAKENTFFLKRGLPKFQDVAIPICYDTIAKASFRFLNGNALKLLNDKDFFKVYFDFKQEKNFSEDSIYIRILLPAEDAFAQNRFRYLFNFGCIVSQIRSDTTFLKIPKKLMINCGSTYLGFLVQDLSPQQCIEDEKCYQRILFRIFDLLRIDKGNNYFTVSLLNFTECFVERMDVDNDIIYFDGNNSIIWRGKEYKRVI